jgi:hypothetical protein
MSHTGRRFAAGSWNFLPKVILPRGRGAFNRKRDVRAGNRYPLAAIRFRLPAMTQGMHEFVDDPRNRDINTSTLN